MTDRRALEEPPLPEDVQERRASPRRQSDADRTPPHNLEAEMSVLGALLISHEVWATAAAVVAPDDFYRTAHRTIYRRMLGLLERGVPIDFTILIDELRRYKELEAVGGPVYISALVDGLPHATHVEYYAGIVRETARLRSTIRIAEGMVASAYERNATAVDIVERGVTGLLGVADSGEATVTSLGAAMKEYVEALDAPTGAHRPVPCGFADIDRLIGGWGRGQLVIVAARTSVGKSSFALGSSYAMARTGTPTAFVSLEMSRQALTAQVLSWRSKVPADRVRRGEAVDAEFQRIGQAWTELADVPLHIVESARTLTQVAAWARRLRDQKQVGCIVVDYLQRLSHDTGRGHGGSDKRRLEVAAISAGLKRIALDLDVVMLALSQLSRAPEGRTDKRPLLSDLRESGDIEQDADVAVLLFREEMHKKKDDNEGIAEAIVAKNRSGPVGTVKLYFDRHLAQFRDLAQ
jgi:replicative DNA helicase